MNTVIIDIGTSWGAPNGWRLKRLYNLPAVFIDADIDALRRVPAEERDIKVHGAITSYDGEIEFNFYPGDGTHSVLETNTEEMNKYLVPGDGGPVPSCAEGWTVVRKVKVPCATLKTVIEKLKIDFVQFLKIDTQGHDFEVIKSLGDKFNIVKFIKCEVQVTDFEVYKNQSKKEDVVNFLKEKGFELINISKETFDQEEDLIFENKNIP